MDNQKPDQHLVRIFMNDKPFELPAGKYTGAELKKRTNVPHADLLYRIQGQKRHEIHDTEEVEIHNDEHFVAVPRHGGAG